MPDSAKAVKHPAKFSHQLLPVLARYIDGADSVGDPFGGTGGVGRIRSFLTVNPDTAVICASDLEAEWIADGKANGCNLTAVGDARQFGALFGGRQFQAIVSSPTYSNRMADACDWAEGRRHSTYTSALRETTGDPTRDLTPGNAGAMQWGDAYRALHRDAWAEAWRVLIPGGRLVINVADHFRDSVLQGVPEWHVSALLAIGFELRDWVTVGTARYGFGANAEKRSPELVILLEKPGGDGPAWVHNPLPSLARIGHLWDVAPEPMQLAIFER